MTEVISQHEELKGRLFKDDNYNLTIRCDEKDVIVENIHGDCHSILKRTDGCWFLCYTWTRTWLTDSPMGKADPNAKSASVFVNLKTGEMHSAHPFILFRSHFTFSPDNNFLLIQGGICASSASEIILVDLRNLSNVNVIFREEIWEFPCNYQFSFNENSDLVAKYSYDFFEYKGKRACGEYNIQTQSEDRSHRDYNLDEIKKMINPSYPNLISEREMWRAGVTFNEVTVTVVRRINPSKVTPPSDHKWKEQEYIDPNYEKEVAEYMAQGLDGITISKIMNAKPRSEEEIAHIKKFDSKYGSTCTVNEMDEIEVIKSDNYDHFIGNVENPFDYRYE